MNMQDSEKSKSVGVPLFKFERDKNIQKLQDELINANSDTLGMKSNMERELERERTPAENEDNKIRYNALILNTFPPLREQVLVRGKFQVTRLASEVKDLDAPVYSSPNLSYKQRRSEYKRWEKHRKENEIRREVRVSQYGEASQKKPEEEEKKEAEKIYEKLGYKKVMKNGKEVKEQRLVDYTEVRDQKLFLNKEWREEWANTKMGRSNLTRREIIQQVGNGDYSHFENLDDTMRNMFAKEALDRMVKKYTDNNSVFDYEPKKICNAILEEGGVSALLDAPLRLGLSLAQRENTFYPEDTQKNWFRKLDEQMSAAVMLETLKQKDQNQLQSQVASELMNKPNMNAQDALKSAQGMVEADKAQKIQTAKRLLLMHLGQFTKVDERGEQSDWDKPVAVALSHCSRVTLVLPKRPAGKYGQKAYKEMWNSIFYQQGDEGQFNSNLAQDNRRAASTHSIKVRRNAVGEKKVPFNLRGQRGMNVAIGGLGNQGVSGKMLLNDGSCGHFYSMYKEGDTKHYGAILMGLESDSPGTMNQLGHIHDARATAEKASSLGGQRTDEVGKKYGGRRCIIRKDPNTIANYMKLLEEVMKKNALDMKAMEMLVGPPMTDNQLYEFGTLLEIGASL